MEEHFDFGSGRYRLVRSEDELVPGEKYLIRSRDDREGMLIDLISTYETTDFPHLVFETIYMRRAIALDVDAPFQPWHTVDIAYAEDHLKYFAIPHLQFEENAVLGDERFQLFSLGREGQFITPDSPPDRLRTVLNDILDVTHRVGDQNHLPASVIREINHFSAGKRKRTKKTKSRKLKKSKKI